MSIEAARRDGQTWGLVPDGEQKSPTSNMDVLIHSFSEYLLAHRKSPKTVKEYVRDVESWAAWWKRDPAKFEGMDYDAWTYQQMRDGYTGSTVKRHRAAVRKFFRFLTRKGLVERDPGFGAESVNVPKRLPKWLTESECQSLINYSKASRAIRSRAMLHLLYYCGLRNAEMRGVLIENITPKYVRIVGKRDKERMVPMAPEAWNAVQDYLAVRPANDSPHLFVTCNGNIVGEVQVHLVMRSAAKMAGIAKRVTAHTLRHSIATHMLDRGLDLRHIMEFLGHESVETTQIYTHVAKASLMAKVKLFRPTGQQQAGIPAAAR
jgi:integrase/recombinase XerD